MAKQKKIIDVHEGHVHMTCIQFMEERSNPYRIYMVISPSGSPVRKRELIRYEDFMSVIYFIRDFFLYGLDTMPLCEIMEWIKEHSI